MKFKSCRAVLVFKGLAAKLENILFWLSVWSIPINLGKHFVLEESYIFGKLLDYTIPTIFVPDVLIFMLLVVSLSRFLTSQGSIARRKIFQNHAIALLLLFFAVCLFSAWGALAFVPSFYVFLRFVLYGFFAFYIFLFRDFSKDYKGLSTIFIFWTFFLAVLAFAQWFKQGSVFNNYLIFGEQPYTFSTPGIVRENFFGRTKVPPYGIFRHPNTFAAFISFAVLFVAGISGKFSKRVGVRLLIYSLGFVTLLLTMSRFVFIGFLLSLLFLYFPNKRVKPCVLGMLTWGAFLNFALFLPLDIPLLETTSLLRRRNLLQIGFAIFKDFPLFGVGLNNFLYLVDSYAVMLDLPKFTQPIHNIYMLFLVETGVFGFGLFVWFLRHVFKGLFGKIDCLKDSSRIPSLLVVLLGFLLFVSFFDHFLITSHQIQLLFWLTLGFSLQYN